MPSSRRRQNRSPSPKSSQDPEILHQLGRAVLTYSLKKLAEQKAQSQSSSQSKSRHGSHSSRRKHDSTSNPRDLSSTGSKRATSRDLPRGDSSDLHSLLSQLAVGVFAFGIRHLIKRRRDAKRKAAAAASKAAAAARDMGVGHGQQSQRQTAVDSELSAALESVTKELQGVTESIRRLAYSAPAAAHRECAVRDALVRDADRLGGSLADLQASINNMRNLHPGLEVPRRRREEDRGVKRRREERNEDDRVRSRGAEAVEEGARRRRHRSRQEDGGEAAERHRSHMGDGTGEVAEHRRHRTHRRHREAEEAPEEEMRRRRHRSHRMDAPTEEAERRRHRSRRSEREDAQPGESGSEPLKAYREHHLPREQPVANTRSRRSRRDEEVERGRRPVSVERRQ